MRRGCTIVTLLVGGGTVLIVAAKQAGFDTLAAPIALAAVIIGALIACGFTIYQLRYNARLEEENLRLKDQIAAVRAAQERERKQREMEEAAALSALREAQRIENWAQAYRQALRHDPHISQLKILSMQRPLELVSVYVPLRLHQQARPDTMDEDLLAAEASREPNAVLRASRMRLESRTSAALDPDQAIRTYKHCVIVGDPGAGKTTLFKNLTLKSAAQGLSGLPDLPIYIELNKFVNSDQQNLLDFASTKWDEYGFPKTEALAYIEKNLQAGNALLLLDGLDETLIGENVDIAEDSYQRVFSLIGQMAHRYPQAFIVVTARKAGYQQRAPLVGFTELEVLDFRPQDIEQFVYNWFTYHPEPQKRADAKGLNAILNQHTRIQTLASNPLLLSLIVIVYEENLELSDRRAELYRQCVDTLLTKWDAEPDRNIRRLRQFKLEHKRQLLKEVAWHFHLQGRRYFPESELLAVIAGFLPAVQLSSERNRDVLDEIVVENGLLKEQARGWYGFLHLTLQEYFVAQHVHDKDRLDTLLEHLGEPWWEEVVLLYTGYIPDASSFLQKLLGNGDQDQIPGGDDIFQSNLILAGRCLAAHPVVRTTSLREKITSRLFETLMKTPYSLTRQQVAEALAEIGGEKVNERLLSLLEDEQISQDVRLSIVNALGVLGERSVANQLLPLLSNEQIDSEVRMSIAHALGVLSERSMASELVSLLSKHSINRDVRKSIALALGELGEYSVAPKLVSLLSNQRVEREVRCSVTDALGMLGTPSVVPDLLQLHSNPQLDFSVRWRIAIALGALGELTIVSTLLPLLAKEQYSIDVRRRMAEALGSLGIRSLASDLLPLLANEQIPWEVRVSIVNALECLGERSIIPHLLQMLGDEGIDQYVRVSIANVLGKLGGRQLIPRLRKLHVDQQAEPYLHRSIVITLGKLGESTMARQLLQWLSDNEIDNLERLSMLDALSVLQESSIIPELLQLLSNAHVAKDVRRGIVNTLAQLAYDRSLIDEIADTLATLLLTSDIADDIHRALWTIKRRRASSSKGSRAEGVG